jgi:hypothetical protein
LRLLLRFFCFALAVAFDLPLTLPLFFGVISTGVASRSEGTQWRNLRLLLPLIVPYKSLPRPQTASALLLVLFLRVSFRPESARAARGRSGEICGCCCCCSGSCGWLLPFALALDLVLFFGVIPTGVASRSEGTQWRNLRLLLILLLLLVLVLVLLLLLRGSFRPESARAASERSGEICCSFCCWFFRRCFLRYVRVRRTLPLCRRRASVLVLLLLFCCCSCFL